MSSEAGPLIERERFARWSHRCIGSVLGILLTTGTAAAQVGDGLCGTPIARLLNEAGPLIVSIVMLGGTLFAMVLHGYAGFIRDREEVVRYQKWRTRAIKGVLGAPILGYLLELMLGYLGLSVAGCIDIVVRPETIPLMVAALRVTASQSARVEVDRGMVRVVDPGNTGPSTGSETTL